MSITDWLPRTPPTLGPGCERVWLKNDVMSIEYDLDNDTLGDDCGSDRLISVQWCRRTWTLVSARRINEAHRFQMPTTDEICISVETANAQIRELLAEGRRMAGSMGAWVLVEGGR